MGSGSSSLAPRNETQIAGFGNPAMAHAARSVFTRRHVTVMGPTPPGTGVIAPATSRLGKATSPTSRSCPRPGQAADADIDHGRARLDPVGAYHFGLPTAA